MTKQVINIQFNYSMPTAQLKTIMPVAAPGYAQIAGCCWKIWLLNEDRKEAGGVYLFESAAAAEQYLRSDLYRSIANNPAFSNLQTHTFGVEEAASLITGAPLVKGLRQAQADNCSN